MNPVASHDGLVEGQSGLRAVPRNELVDGVPVPSLGFLRGQAVEDCRSRLVEVGQAQAVLWRRPPGSVLFATLHEWGLHGPGVVYVAMPRGRWLKLEARAGGYHGRLSGETGRSIARVEARDGGRGQGPYH